MLNIINIFVIANKANKMQKKKPTKKAPVKKVTKAPKKKPIRKLVKFKDEEVLDHYISLLQNGKGATALRATSDKYRINEDETYIIIKGQQELRIGKQLKEAEKIKDPVQRDKALQITNANTLKSAAEKGEHIRERQIGVSKDQRWEHGPKAQLKLLQTVFRGYCETNLGYNREDSGILLQIFNQHIDADNIQHYICRTSQEIYIAIINERLDEIANYTAVKEEVTIDLDTLEVTRTKKSKKK